MSQFRKKYPHVRAVVMPDVEINPDDYPIPEHFNDDEQYELFRRAVELAGDDYPPTREQWSRAVQEISLQRSIR